MTLRESLGERPTQEEFHWRFPQHADRFRTLAALDDALQESTIQGTEGASRELATRSRQPARSRPILAGPWPLLEGYEIEKEIGRGGMGVVYIARQVRLNRMVAIKMVLGGELSSLGTSRLLGEAEAVARLRHPNIVQVHGLGEEDGRLYFVMEYLSGGSLAARLNGRGWPPREAASLLEVLARGIAEAHRQGVVHRDLKPANILLGEDGTPKLADFGLAKILDFDAGLTKTEVILGTPSYMSPEQAEGRHADVGEASDIYSLGAIFYELLTGRPPFRAATMLQTIDLVRNEEPMSPARLHPGLPRDAVTICLKCLEKSPSRRYGSAIELADDLARFLAGQSIAARPSRPWERAVRWGLRKPAIAGLSAACLAALVLGMGGIVWKWRDAEHHRGRVSAAEQKTSQQLLIALAARRDADESHTAAVRTRNDSQRLSANVALSRGLEMARRDQIGPGLLLMLEALKFAPDDDPALIAAVRRNLAAWSARLDGLHQMLMHPGVVTQVAIHPDGKTALTGCGDQSARLWDLKTGDLIGVPWACAGPVECVAFSLDGQLAVTGGGAIAQLRDARTGAPFGPAMNHPGRVPGRCSPGMDQGWPRPAARARPSRGTRGRASRSDPPFRPPGRSGSPSRWPSAPTGGPSRPG